ncbi:hypothetical protein L218DRAFT_887102 [Marasmius fiardii PR-910]|nr:hypothetical protein L218DRAFT_887102 [Marasmius fiardii PR-910]
MDIDQFKHEGRCFDCGEKGHIGRNCPHKGMKDKKYTVRRILQELSEEERGELLKDFQ